MNSSVFAMTADTLRMLVFLVAAAMLSGCGGGAELTRGGEIPTRIESLALDATEEGNVLRLQGNREFRATVQPAEDLKGFDIRVSPAVTTKELNTRIEELRLPRGGILSVRVENLREKLGGVLILVRTERPFSHTASQAGKEFTLKLEPAPEVATKEGTDKQTPDGRGEKQGAPEGKEARFVVPNAPSVSEKDYLIGGKDILKITVFEEPDLSKEEVRVSNDGFITFPLIGRVRVVGLTAQELEKELVRRLGKDFLVNPQITVQVKEFASKIVNVLGAVKTPGALPLKGPVTLLEILARAGGVSIEDAGRNIIILRPHPGQEKGVEHITVNLNQLLKKGDLSQNIALQDKDTVFIPQADQIFVFGEVKSPGPYKLRERSISVVEAITMAGGTTRLAAANRTRVVRVKGEEEQVIQVNVDDITKGDKSRDIQLQAGDIVVVPEAYF